MRFDWLCDQYKPVSKIPAHLTVVDIAGLVKGASEGAGLGNEFLSNIMSVDGIYHIVRAFNDPDVTHVEGDVDPIRDLEIIHEELRKKDAQIIQNLLESKAREVSRLGKGGSAADKAKKEEYEIAKKISEHVITNEKDVRTGDWNNKEVEVLNQLNLLTAKPVVYLCNLSIEDYVKKKNRFLPKIKAWIDKEHPGDFLIPFSGSFEQEYSEKETDELKKNYIESVKSMYSIGSAQLNSTLSKIVTSGYSALNLIYFFTCGPDEVRAWTVRRHSKAPAAAGTIHTDFEKAFIMAEVMKYDDLHEQGTEAKVRAAGKYLQKGKDYVVEDGDILYIKAGQVNPPKKKK